MVTPTLVESPSKKIRIEVNMGNAKPEEVLGKKVIGPLPPSLACLCSQWGPVEFDVFPREKEYGIKEIIESGGRVVEYRVEKVS
jgi:hypothetical protein